MPPKPLEGDFLFAPLFVGLPTLQGDALFGASFLFEQKEVLPPPWALTIAIPVALSGAISSLQARHKKQHLLFFTELLLLPQCWHCHIAARAKADLSILGIPPRIGSGGSNGVKVVLCGVHRGKFGKRGQYLFRSVKPTCAALSTDQISTPYNKRRESQRETQLSVVVRSCLRISASTKENKTKNLPHSLTDWDQIWAMKILTKESILCLRCLLIK
jgi:hypothetical protein